jgi:predicted outer membrane repeat protein
LGEALALVKPDEVVALATPGADTHYIGNWVVATAGTSAAKPVTIEPAPGMVAPELDGNEGKDSGCSTSACDGPVLTVRPGVNVDIEDLAFANADNKATGHGGAIDNHGGTMLIRASSFEDNSATEGGAIDNADCSDATATITGSTFQSNTSGNVGGAIDNGDGGSAICQRAHGTLTVRSSSFSGNKAVSNGGAIDSGDGCEGRLFVYGSDFSDNTAGGEGYSSFGGAVDSAGDAGRGSLTVSATSFNANTAYGYGGAIEVALNSNATVGDSTFFANAVYGNGGALDNQGELNLSESTLAGNEAYVDADGSGQDGMGGAVSNGRRLVVQSSTFSLNEAASLGPDLESGAPVDQGPPSRSVWLAADIMNGPCSIVAAWTDAGYNIAPPSCLKGAAGDVAPPDLARLLGPLAANGGPTDTVLPLQGNPAIGVIPSGTITNLDGTKVTLCPTTDQRGQASSPG